MPFDAKRNANECASILKNATKDLAELKKRQKEVASALETHDTIQNKHNAIVAGYAEDIGEMVEDAKDEAHPGKTIDDFKDVPEVKGLLSALKKFLKGDVAKREKVMVKLHAEAGDVLDAYKAIQKTLEDEIADQAKIAKANGTEAPDPVAKMTTMLKEFKDLLTDAARLVSETEVWVNYREQTERKGNRLIDIEVAKTKQDRKAAAAFLFSQMALKPRPLKKNVGKVENLLDTVEEALERAKEVKGGGMGRSSANQKKLVDDCKAEGQAADAEIQKINAIHVAEYLALSKQTKDSLPLTPEGAKVLALIQRIETAAAESTALMKELWKL